MSQGDSPPVPDFSALARRPSERLAIVRYIRDNPGLQETEYLEWKTGYDLRTRPGAAATAKHLIGFANRDLILAARHAEGHAYLLLGVEPQNLVGVTLWDSADIENWLVRFVGLELRYDVHYVELDGKHVLFLTIDPPRPGDPIYYLHQGSSDPDGKTLSDGTIYVRRGGLTEPAKAADIARLTERCRATARTLDLAVDLDTSELQIIEPDELSDAVRDSWLRDERRALLSSMPAPPQRGSMFDLPDFSGYADSRSRREFTDEVETYVATVREHWASMVTAEYIEEEKSQLTAVVVNESDSNFEDVVVELTLPLDPTWVYTRPGAAGRLRPRRPARWGASFTASLISTPLDIRSPHAPAEPEIERVDRFVSLVRFPPLNVRPHTRHRLERLLVALPPALSGQTLPVLWRVTARNTSGHIQGEVGLVVLGAVADGVAPAPEASHEADAGES